MFTIPPEANLSTSSELAAEQEGGRRGQLRKADKGEAAEAPDKKPPAVLRAALLAEVAMLPSTAFIDTAHAAAFIGTTPSVMYSWRSQRRGPRYHGKAEYIRYTLRDLTEFMATRSGEVAAQAIEDAKFEVASLTTPRPAQKSGERLRLVRPQSEDIQPTNQPEQR